MAFFPISPCGLRSKGDGLHQDLRLLRQVPCRMLGLLEGLHLGAKVSWVMDGGMVMASFHGHNKDTS